MHFCSIKRGIGWLEANSTSVVVVLISKALLGLVRCRRANGSAKVKMVCEFMNEVPCVAVTWWYINLAKRERVVGGWLVHSFVVVGGDDNTNACRQITTVEQNSHALPYFPLTTTTTRQTTCHSQTPPQ